MKKFLGILIVVMLVLFVVVVLAKNTIAKIALTGGVKGITGLKAEVQGVDVGVTNTQIGIKEFKLFNPSGFQNEAMMDMPELFVNYDLASFFKGKIHLEELRLNLKEFVVVKNEKGELNLDSLKSVKKSKEAKEEKPKEESKMPEIQIDVFHLKIGRVLYKDYSGGGKPQVNEFDVGIDEKYENITNPQALASLIITKALMNTTIAKLTNFDLGSLQQDVTGVLKLGTSVATETVGKAAETLGGVAGEGAGIATDTVGKATETVGGAAKKGADVFKKILPGSED